MARPIYQHELIDPDFAWLINTFKEAHPEFFTVESSGIPVILFKLTENEFQQSMLPVVPPKDLDDIDHKDRTE